MSLRFRELIEIQLKERYKHCVIYSLPMTGVTSFGKQICKKYDGYYLDVLQEVNKDEDISNSLGMFYPEDFFKWLKKYNSEKKFIVIDNFDFLINTWRSDQEEIFLNLVEKQESEVMYIFLIQQRKFITKRIIENIMGKSRIINLYEIN